jgi:integrase
MEKLFFYRRVMRDGMIIDPLNGETSGNLIGWDITSLLEAQTEVIPDETLGVLVRAALDYIDRFAGYLLDVSEAVEAVRQPGRRLDAKSAGCLQRHNPSAYGLDGTKLERGLPSMRELNKELCYLQTACFVLIAFSTGMRVSEILSLREGCCETQTETGQADLIWLHSRVFKMQGVPEGRKAKWLGGPVSARAIDVLEQLTRTTRRRTKVRSLWVPIAALVLKPRDAGALKGDTIRYRLEVFVTMLGLKDSSGRPFHLHPHMFRRTFARHVVRHDTTNLLALKEHFKHVSLSMTDLYVGSDVELWQLMVAEEEKLLFESFEKALRAERMAGPGGSKLKKKIDAAIAEGRLPKEFRGEAGDHLRKEMIRDLVESGQRIYPCAASNYCWFRPEFALCTQEDHPLLKRCNPGACTNSIITLEHKPHWEKILSDCENLIELKPKAEPYQKAIRNIHTVSRKILQGLS